MLTCPLASLDTVFAGGVAVYERAVPRCSILPLLQFDVRMAFKNK
jgi:hypothetical protein